MKNKHFVLFPVLLLLLLIIFVAISCGGDDEKPNQIQPVIPVQTTTHLSTTTSFVTKTTTISTSTTTTTTALSGCQPGNIYFVEEIANNTFSSIAGSSLFIGNGDEANFVYQLPFDIYFYGNKYSEGSSIYVNSNGVLSFSINGIDENNHCISDYYGYPDEERPLIALFHDNLILDNRIQNGGIWVEVSDTKNKRVLTFEWLGCHYDTYTELVNFQIKFYEESPCDFSIIYGSMSDDDNYPDSWTLGSAYDQQFFNDVYCNEPGLSASTLSNKQWHFSYANGSPVSTDKPIIDNMSPSYGANFRPMYLTINGSNFKDGCMVKLSSASGITTWGNDLSVDSTSISGTFNLTDFPAEFCDITVINPDFNFEEKISAFEVREAVYNNQATSVSPQWMNTLPPSWGTYTGNGSSSLDDSYPSGNYTVERNGMPYNLSGNYIHIDPYVNLEGTASGYMSLSGTVSLPFVDNLIRLKINLDIDDDGLFFDYDDGGSVKTSQHILLHNGTTFSTKVFFPYGTGNYRVGVYIYDQDYSCGSYVGQQCFYVYNNVDTSSYFYIFPSLGARSEDPALYDLGQQIIDNSHAISELEKIQSLYDWLGWYMRYDNLSNPNRTGRRPSRSLTDIEGYFNDPYTDPIYSIEVNNGYRWGICRDYATFYLALLRSQ